MGVGKRGSRTDPTKGRGVGGVGGEGPGASPETRQVHAALKGELDHKPFHSVLKTHVLDFI